MNRGRWSPVHAQIDSVNASQNGMCRQGLREMIAVPSDFPSRQQVPNAQLISLSASSAESPIVYVPTCDKKSARG